MLKQLRNKKTAKKIWIGLAVIIVPAFVFWGFGGAFKSSKDTTSVGKLFGKSISSLEYREAYEAVKNASLMQFGDKFAELEKYLNLNRQAWERLVLLSEAKKRRISVSDKEVVELLQSYPFFQRKGQFDDKIYSEVLRYVFRTQPRAFEEQTRANLMLSKLYRQLTDGVTVSPEEVKNEYKKINEEISVNYIAGLTADFSKSYAAGENEIRDFFSKNSLAFKQPLSYNVEYLAFDSQEKADEAYARLNKKADFEKTAKDLGIEAKETGFFAQTDPIPGIGWSAEMMMLIAKLNPGRYSPVINIEKKFYILRLKEKKEAHVPEFSEVKEKVKKSFIAEKAKEAAKGKTEACLKALKEAYKTNPKSADFGKFAKTFGLKSDSTGLFKYGSYIEGIGSSDELWTAARNLKDNEFSEMISLPSGFYIVSLKSKAALDEKKFESEKKEFGEKLLEQRKQEAFLKFAEELSAKSGLPSPAK